MMFGGQCLFGLLGYDFFFFFFVPLLTLIVAESYSNAAIVSPSAERLDPFRFSNEFLFAELHVNYILRLHAHPVLPNTVLSRCFLTDFFLLNVYLMIL